MLVFCDVKLKQIRERATEKSSVALFRDKNFLFIKKMKGIAKLAFFMIEYSTP